jgi:hypothetical protein
VTVKSAVLWVVTPCSLEQARLLLLVSFLAYSSTLKMKAIVASETSVSL